MSCAALPLPVFGGGTPAKVVASATPTVAAGDLLIPEFWARESLRILEENMVMGEIIHRDFTKLRVDGFNDTVTIRGK